MRIGVIVGLTEVRAPGSKDVCFLPGFSCMIVDVLGRSILDRILDRLTAATHTQPIVVVERLSVVRPFPCDDINLVGPAPVWEKAIRQQILSGVDQLLLLRLNSYTDLDFGELIQWHTGARSTLTRVYGPTGALDIAVVDANSLRDSDNQFCNTLSEIIFRQRRFLYRGYCNALAGPDQLRRLAEDGLYGRCGLSPVGVEVRPRVWYGIGAQVHSSAIIRAPAFIGMAAHICECCTIDRASVIEHGCTVDYKSTIQQSCLLQNTRIGVSLTIHHSLAFNNTLFHLDYGVKINCDTRLVGVKSRSADFAWKLAECLRRRRVLQRNAEATQLHCP